MVPQPSTMRAQAYENALNTSALELKYAQNTHTVDIISKDEDIRRLRFDVHILEDDCDELRDLLQQEEDRSDAFEKLVNENLARAEDAEAALVEVEAELRAREQDGLRLEAEAQALRGARQDNTAVLTEKLALTRELSVLKPELEHLKAQAESIEQLLSDKLALQRQLTEIQCEVENARREAKRALAKRINTGFEIAQEEQLDDLKKQLAKEKRARERAEEATEDAQGDMDVNDIRKQLSREKKAREKLEEELAAMQENTQIEDVRKDLLKEKKTKQRLEDVVETLQAELDKERKTAARAAKRANGNAGADDQAEELRQELAKEKKERQRAEKNVQKAAEEHEAQQATLNDKLNQFRRKLKDTKDRLKEAEAQLTAAKEVAPPAVKKAPAKPAAKAAAAKAPAVINAKKRSAATMDPDTSALGTPGDGPAVKRGRKAAGVGDKSTFSITPFLNRTMSTDVERDGSDAEAQSPAANKAPAKTALAPAASSKANAQPTKKPAVQRKLKLPVMAVVAEEDEDVHTQGQENAKPAAGMKIKTKVTDGTEHVSSKPKPRKSLVDFETFRQQDARVTQVQPKKRKLGGLGKTLFDEEEEALTTTKAGFGSRALFGTKGYGVLAGGKKGSSLIGKSSGVGRSVLLSAADGSGFQFSPLKRSRKVNLDDTLRG
ncbi:hypothetical protein LTR95_014148 [Oleoguttula sp. CCFEE 5521]